MSKTQNRESRPERKEARQEQSATAAPGPAGSAGASGLPLAVRWLFSKTVRQACAMAKHVHKLINHQRDILSSQALQNLEGAVRELKATLASAADKPALEKQMENLETVANKWLKPYPNAAWRENVEVLLVALAVAMGIRTFFLQPFKIPTGSMQPTLFGVTSKNLLDHPKMQLPTGLERIKEWFKGKSYIHVVADNEGAVGPIEPPLKLLIFNIKQTFYVGGQPYTIWFPPDYGSQTLAQRAELSPDKIYHPGEDIIKLEVSAGDHLFVDRLTYNFCRPHRGQIIVFETKGIPEERRIGPGWQIPPDEFYIKRLVGLGGERVQIGNDRHLIIDGKHLDASTPHFQNLYSFPPNQPTMDSVYSGHDLHPGGGVAPYFADKPDGVVVPKGDYLVMGDNTASSLDSRFWGPLDGWAVIGKAFFVYWPLTERFGWGYDR